MRYYRPVDRDIVQIDDLITLTSLATDPNGTGTYSETWTLNTDFTAEPDNAAADGWPWTMLRRHPAGNYWFRTTYPRSVKVTGKFGWLAVPPTVVEATTILATRLLRRAREAPFGVVSLGMDGSATYISKNDPDVGFLLRDFMRRGAGIL